MATIAGYNPDGTPYYAPDALGISIGRIDPYTGSGPGPTAGNLAGAGLPQSQTPLGFWTDAGSALENALPTLAPIVPGAGLFGSVSNAIGGMGKAASAASSAWGFITDIPRVATTLLGIILLIAGIFALTKGPAVNIVASAVREAATS